MPLGGSPSSIPLRMDVRAYLLACLLPSLLTSVNCFHKSYFMWWLALASELVGGTDLATGMAENSVAEEPPRSIAGEFDGEVMVGITRTHPSITIPDITSPSQITWKLTSGPPRLPTRLRSTT